MCIRDRYIYDSENGAFGCIHSGWVGSFENIGSKAIKMTDFIEDSVVLIWHGAIIRKTGRINAVLLKKVQ